MIRTITHHGRFISECPFPGETRADEVFPAHPNGIQLSRDRFLVLYATRGYRGTDDDRSIVAQIRRDSYLGPVVREIMLSQSVNDWQPPGLGEKLIRQHGHPVAFGVPAGVPAPHANVFVIKWRVRGLRLDPATGLLVHESRHELRDATQGVEWMQVRLNAAGDDLEILQPRSRLDILPAGAKWMNQTFVQAVPFNADASEWADVNHFDGQRLAALRYRFNAPTGRYEVAQTSALFGDVVHEASLVRYRNDWVIAARQYKAKAPVAWARVHDLFGEMPVFVDSPNHCNNAPVTVYGCPDGVVRLVGGDQTVSPHKSGRDPLYIWDVDPEAGFAVSNRRVVFDSRDPRSGLPASAHPWTIDMGKLLPHTGGATQMLLHRVRSKATKDPKKVGTPISPAEMAAGGIYAATVEYGEAWPGRWSFA